MKQILCNMHRVARNPINANANAVVLGDLKTKVSAGLLQDKISGLQGRISRKACLECK